MVKKAQKLFFFVFLVMSAFIQGRSVIDDSLEDFLTRTAEEEEKVGFRGYYSRFLEKQSRTRKGNKRRHLRRIRAASLKKVREAHPEWYKEVEPFALDLDEPTPEARKARLFLTRFSLLEEYRQSLKPNGLGWWDKTKTYLRGFGHKVVELKDKALGRKKTAKA
jgi:hypothetical protein